MLDQIAAHNGGIVYTVMTETFSACFNVTQFEATLDNNCLNISGSKGEEFFIQADDHWRYDEDEEEWVYFTPSISMTLALL